MASNIRDCQITVIIGEHDKILFSGSIGHGLNWTPLECAFIVQAMSTVMQGTTDTLIVEMGIARLVGTEKRVGAAAKQVGLSRKTFTKMMGDKSNYKRRGKKDD